METSSLPHRPLPYKKLVIALSIAVPLVVALLFQVRIEGYDFSFLPPIYAAMNAVTALSLLFSLWAIRGKRITLHKQLNTLAVGLSAVFLVLYVIYHATSDPTPFGGEGWVKTFYYFILITHILLSIVVIPFVLFTYLLGYHHHIQRHRKLARITWPLWVYVATTGVIVYLMISPYYV